MTETQGMPLSKIKNNFWCKIMKYELPNNTSFYFFFSVQCFETETHYVDQTSLELTMYVA